MDSNQLKTSVFPHAWQNQFFFSCLLPLRIIYIMPAFSLTCSNSDLFLDDLERGGLRLLLLLLGDSLDSERLLRERLRLGDLDLDLERDADLSLEPSYSIFSLSFSRSFCVISRMLSSLNCRSSSARCLRSSAARWSARTWKGTKSSFRTSFLQQQSKDFN